MAQHEDDIILHQDEVEEVIEDVIEGMDIVATGDPEAAITNASTAHAFNSTFADAELETACNALGTKINAILAVLRTKEIIET